MKKNLLAENMLRFGTKNLSDLEKQSLLEQEAAANTFVAKYKAKNPRYKNSSPKELRSMFKKRMDKHFRVLENLKANPQQGGALIGTLGPVGNGTAYIEIAGEQYQMDYDEKTFYPFSYSKKPVENKREYISADLAKTARLWMINSARYDIMSNTPGGMKEGKTLSEQQTGETITTQWSKVKLSNQYARTKYKAKTSDGTGSVLAFDYEKPGTAEKQKGTYYMTLRPNPRVFADKTEYPFTSLTVSYDPVNSPDKIRVDAENLNKANLKAKGFDYKALVSDCKRTVARQHVKFPPTK